MCIRDRYKSVFIYRRLFIFYRWYVCISYNFVGILHRGVRLERLWSCLLYTSKSTIKYYRGISFGLHSHLYSMGGIFTERGIEFMTAKEYRALLDTDFSDVKINEMPDMASYHADLNDTIEKRCSACRASSRSSVQKQ